MQQQLLRRSRVLCGCAIGQLEHTCRCPCGFDRRGLGIYTHSTAGPLACAAGVQARKQCTAWSPSVPPMDRTVVTNIAVEGQSLQMRSRCIVLWRLQGQNSARLECGTLPRPHFIEQASQRSYGPGEWLAC